MLKFGLVSTFKRTREFVIRTSQYNVPDFFGIWNESIDHIYALVVELESNLIEVRFHCRAWLWQFWKWWNLPPSQQKVVYDALFHVLNIKVWKYLGMEIEQFSKWTLFLQGQGHLDWNIADLWTTDCTIHFIIINLWNQFLKQSHLGVVKVFEIRTKWNFIVM